MNELTTIIALFILIVGLFVTSCKSPYPPCTEPGEYRCNGFSVELCDGHNWQPREDCANMSLECVENGEQTGCKEF
jgi:hypothetical protein